MVDIYQDPLAQTRHEGRAKLVKFQGDAGVYDGRIIERWQVRFDGEGGTFYRTILTDKPYRG